jgi:enamidase
MAHDAPAAPSGPQKLVIRNIGLLLSGDLERPILDADAVVAVDGRIAAVGRLADLDTEGATTLVDAGGAALAPGLIDSHVHPVAGDWTPRQNQIGWIDSCLHGGVTTMISAGEVHMPGRPRDIVGLKAMAITAQRIFAGFRPSGVKLHAGAPVIEPGMVEQDFADLAAAGVRLLGEVGLGGVKDGANAREMVAWARKHGIQSTIHTGGPSIPGSGLIGADVVLEADTDVVGHINGGHTALPDAEIRCICEGCKRGLELVHNGNERAALYTLRVAKRDGRAPARHPRHRRAGRLRRAAARHPPDGLDARPRSARCRRRWRSASPPATRPGCAALDCGLIEVGPLAPTSCFMDKAQHSAGKDLPRLVSSLGDLPGVGMIGDRRDRPQRPQPQHAAGRPRADRPARLRRGTFVRRSPPQPIVAAGSVPVATSTSSWRCAGTRFAAA